MTPREDDAAGFARLSRRTPAGLAEVLDNFLYARPFQPHASTGIPSIALAVF
jgi:hypothetical protein